MIWTHFGRAAIDIRLKSGLTDSPGPSQGFKMETPLQVDLAERSYPIFFGSDLTEALGGAVRGWLGEGRKVLVVTDENISKVQGQALQRLAAGAPILTLPAGESTKSLEHLGLIWDRLAEERVDRAGLVVAVGGGVMGDLAGFAAGSFLRGIDFVQVPTTLLAMVDSSVGGKTGINLRAGKNLVGAFHQPKAVYLSMDLLQTLPPREFAAGMAEVIKYGLLGDRALFDALEAKPLTAKSAELTAVVRRCCAIKAGIVRDDERETAKEGGRALLNLGHTFGHAIEQVTKYKVYLHGEAVAVGLCAAARLSRLLGYIDEAAVARVDRVVAAHGLPVRLLAPLPIDALLDAMARDKKVRAGMPRFVVLKSLGVSATQSGIERAPVVEVWKALGGA